VETRSARLLFLASVFTIATCGLVYELTAGTLASYLLGDSVTQFSTIIGVYLFAMGVGSWLSQFIERHLLTVFIRVEFIIALIGGSSAAVLSGLGVGQQGLLALPMVSAPKPPLPTPKARGKRDEL
jgi:spermidine synthase